MREAMQAELEDLGLMGSPLSRGALAVAAKIDAGMESGSGMAALLREFRAVRAEIMAGAAKAGDSVDEMRVRRDAKRDRATAG